MMRFVFWFVGFFGFGLWEGFLALGFCFSGLEKSWGLGMVSGWFGMMVLDVFGIC